MAEEYMDTFAKEWKLTDGRTVRPQTPDIAMALASERTTPFGGTVHVIGFVEAGRALTALADGTHYICQLVCGNFDLSLKGELDFLDGVIFSDFCLTVQMISDIWVL